MKFRLTRTSKCFILLTLLLALGKLAGARIGWLIVLAPVLSPFVTMAAACILSLVFGVVGGTIVFLIDLTDGFSEMKRHRAWRKRWGV